MTISVRLAWRNIWRQPRRTWLTAGAIIFSNILLVFIISVQLGVYQLMLNKTLGIVTGHLQVQHADYLDDQDIRQVVPQARKIAGELRSGTGLQSIAARAEAFVISASAERTYGIRIIGVEPDFEPHVSSIPGDVVQGRYLSDPNVPEIVIGAGLARNLKVEVGDELTILGSGLDGSFAAAVVVVVGFFESGLNDLDRSLAQVPLEFFQETFAMRESAHSVVLLGSSLFGVDTIIEAVRPLLPRGHDLTLLDWNDLQPGLMQAIQADLIGAWFMYGILVILVAFSVLNTQLMSVLERTKEFGVVMSLGMTPGRLGRLVLLETTLIALLGMAIGICAGAAITGWFEIHGFNMLAPNEMAGQVILPERIYPDLNPVSLLLGPAVVFLAGLLAAVYPMIRLYWLDPVQAMRST